MIACIGSSLYLVVTNPQTDQKVRKTIAILEPHEILRLCLEEIMIHLNYEIVARSGDSLDFIEQLAMLENTPDAIISETQLTDLPDISLFRHLKFHYPEVPILAFSADDTMYSVDLALAEGADGFLEKGCSLQQLQERLVEITMKNLIVKPNGVLSR